MYRFLLALLLSLAVALPGLAQERPRAGLMWNRSGLPATLPLVVKTFPGKDYLIQIAETDSDQAVMTGYIHGGKTFRLLVPPGRWAIRFAHGRDWQGEDKLFGDATEWTYMPEPLEFGAGMTRRRGHVITLIERNGKMRVAGIRRQDQCQMASLNRILRGWEGANREIASLLAGNGQGEFWGELRYLEPDRTLREIVCG